MKRPHRAARTKNSPKWWICGLLISAIGIIELSAKSASAADLNQLRTEIMDLEQTAKNLTVRYKIQAASQEQLAEHRLVDAQVLYNMRDYSRAAILLFDYVSKYKSTVGYPEALFYLADSLYHKRDFLSAHRYFKIIVNEIQGKYYQESLQRMVELSLRAGGSEDVSQYLNALSNIPTDQVNPGVSYVKGKYFYFKKETDKAIENFKIVKPRQRYYMHSQYFIGASFVQKKDYARAAKVFSALLQIQPKTNGEKHIQDLTHLAMGRLYYQKGDISKAIADYLKLSRQSKEFETALYESSWAYIKSKDYNKAYRALELLVLANPESPFVPGVKVLQGNLLIRLQRWGEATDLFTKTREKFLPVRKRLTQVMEEHDDPNVFFDLLLKRNLSELAISVQVPQLAMHWVTDEPQVKRALHLVKDVRSIKKSIEEIQNLIQRLEQAINSPAKVKVFPEFSTAKARALEVENRTTIARQQILQNEFNVVSKIISTSQLGEIVALQRKRENLENALGVLPTEAKEYLKLESTLSNRIESIEQRASEFGLMVDHLQAQLVAMKKFFADTATATNKARRENFQQDVQQMQKMIDDLRSQTNELQRTSSDAKAEIGVAVLQGEEERKVKNQHKELATKEQQALILLRTGLGDRERAKFDALANLFDRCEEIDNTLLAFNVKLEQNIEEKLVGIRASLAEEKQQLVIYNSEVAQYKTDTDDVAGHITQTGFHGVAKRFYEIVVRADIGIIDVAWALKDVKSKEVSTLVRQRKQELKLLDDEFQQVLQED